MTKNYRGTCHLHLAVAAEAPRAVEALEGAEPEEDVVDVEALEALEGVEPEEDLPAPEVAVVLEPAVSEPAESAASHASNL